MILAPNIALVYSLHQIQEFGRSPYGGVGGNYCVISPDGRASLSCPVTLLGTATKWLTCWALWTATAHKEQLPPAEPLRSILSIERDVVARWYSSWWHCGFTLFQPSRSSPTGCLRQTLTADRSKPSFHQDECPLLRKRKKNH